MGPFSPTSFPALSLTHKARAIIRLAKERKKRPAVDGLATPEDLFQFKVSFLLRSSGPKSVRPRPPTATSIPSMLGLFQSEWDSTVLETYSLRQQLEEVTLFFD